MSGSVSCQRKEKRKPNKEAQEEGEKEEEKERERRRRKWYMNSEAQILGRGYKTGAKLPLYYSSE